MAEYILKFPGIDQTLAHGENKVSFTLEDGLQVDVRMLEKENFGAALLYFTGSKEHNVALRGRANEMGWTLNEYELAVLEESGEWRVASGEKEKKQAKNKGKSGPGRVPVPYKGEERITKGGKRWREGRRRRFTGS